MFEIVELLEEKHVTDTREMTWALAKCLTCGEQSRILLQNLQKSNRLKRQYCSLCIKSTFHNMTNTPFWNIWRGLKYRAQDKSDKDYGGRGISMCDSWLEFSNFYKDMYSTYEEGLTIERINVNLGYSKENCTWITMFK